MDGSIWCSAECSRKSSNLFGSLILVPVRERVVGPAGGVPGLEGVVVCGGEILSALPKRCVIFFDFAFPCCVMVLSVVVLVLSLLVPGCVVLWLVPVWTFSCAGCVWM